MPTFTCEICKGEQTPEEVKLYFGCCHKCWVWFTGKTEQDINILDPITNLIQNSAENS